MLTLGLLSREFPSESLDANLDAIAGTGAVSVQFDLASAVAYTFPTELSEETVMAINAGFSERQLTLAALSGTYNMIDPDLKTRALGAEGLDRVIALAPRLGTNVVTLCTGSRDPSSMWRRHPDNDAPEAWVDLLAQIEKAVRVAEEYGVTLGVEPEIGNTINSVRKARRLLDEVKSSRLKIIMDGANIFQRGQLSNMREVLDEAFELLGSDIVLAHAKDLDKDGEAGHVPAGRGRLDYPYYMGLLRKSGFEGSIILHALNPAEAKDRLAFVRSVAPPGYV
ncbi:MAG TPA: sugar phosphate isomerase/epimerase [Chthoniobacterales bacterium]|jgi:sugar phosphate isomerase/epimerase|nr:sugar phosphate isomerase/epimerase [Chthoniobacterales bacterium]